MIRNQHSSRPWLLLAAGLLLAAIGPGAQAQTNAQSKLDSLFGEEVVARGTGFEIKRSALDESVVTIRSSAAGRGQTLAPTATPQLEREVLSRLINIALLLQRATEEDRERGLEVVEERLATLEERAGSEETLARQLKAVGLTLDRLRAKLIEEATAEKVLQRELAIEIDDAQVKAFYDENPARFERPEMVRAAHILLRTTDPETGEALPEARKEEKRKQLESILRRARQGQEFSELAVEFSEDTASRDTGGEYTFPRGRMVPEFEAAAFSLSPGEISDIVTTKYGYHIIKLYERMPATTLELNEEVAAEVRQFLEAREVRERMEPFMETLREKANVEILSERLKSPPEE